MPAAVDILLSTYDGERHLPALLASLRAQSFADWRLLVRDDGSADRTLAAVEAFAAGEPQRVVLADRGGPRLGPCQSYSRLMGLASAPYVMFCDQDDVWLESKIERTLAVMRASEGGDPERPVLVYTDLRVVDERLAVLSDSLFARLHIAPRLDRDPYYVAFKNPAAGCTIMLNRSALSRCWPIGPGAVMHDWWCAVACALAGRLVHLEEATALYRQHPRNVYGADTRGIAVQPPPGTDPRAAGTALRVAARGWLNALRYHRMVIAQGRAAGRRAGRRFSVGRYAARLLRGRLAAGLVPRSAAAWRY